MQPPPGYPQGQQNPQFMPANRPQQPAYPQHQQPQPQPYPQQQYAPQQYAPQYGQYPYYPPQKRGLPGWAWGLIIGGIVLFLIVPVMAVAAIPLMTSNTRDARRAEGEQLLNSARDASRVHYAKTGYAPARLSDFTDPYLFEGLYFAVDDNILLRPPARRSPARRFRQRATAAAALISSGHQANPAFSGTDMQPAPWETGDQQPTRGAHAPWEEGGQSPVPPAPMPPAQYAPPPPHPAPATQQGGFKLFPTDRRRQILVIAFLVVFFIVGPFLMWLGRGGPKGRERAAGPETPEQQLQIVERQRTVAEDLLRRAVVHLRSQDDGKEVTRRRIIGELEAAATGWRTEHYGLTQVTANSAPSNTRKFDVVLICMPLPAATEKEIAGYARFSWSSSVVTIEWK